MVEEFKIEGMSCHHCVMAVEMELRSAGFNNFKVKIGSAKVEYDGSTEERNKIKRAIEEAGYTLVDSSVA